MAGLGQTGRAGRRGEVGRGPGFGRRLVRLARLARGKFGLEHSGRVAEREIAPRAAMAHPSVLVEQWARWCLDSWPWAWVRSACLIRPAFGCGNLDPMVKDLAWVIPLFIMRVWMLVFVAARTPGERRRRHKSRSRTAPGRKPTGSPRETPREPSDRDARTRIKPVSVAGAVNGDRRRVPYGHGDSVCDGRPLGSGGLRRRGGVQNSPKHPNDSTAAAIPGSDSRRGRDA